MNFNEREAVKVLLGELLSGSARIKHATDHTLICNCTEDATIGHIDAYAHVGL